MLRKLLQKAAICHTCYTWKISWKPNVPSLLLLDALYEVIVPLQEVLVRTLFTHGPPQKGWWKQTEGSEGKELLCCMKYYEISASPAGLLENIFSKWRSTEPTRGFPVIFTLPGLQIKCGAQKCTSDIKTGQRLENEVSTMNNIE